MMRPIIRSLGRRLLPPAALLIILGFCSQACADGWKLPPLPPAEDYGNILIDRLATKNGVKKVAFPHWIHRLKYNCRVCHSELGFSMTTNFTEVTEAANREGKFCGACHNGIRSFPLEGNCDRCHRGELRTTPERREEFFRLPTTAYGYGVDWLSVREEASTPPLDTLKNGPTPLVLENILTLDAEWNFVPPSIFPHKTHTELIDCNTCHPDLFNIQKKGTEDFTMQAMLNGEFCGLCHRSVAFPLNDCKRCHPGLKSW